MLKTGLANMAYGVLIALVGAVITGVTYSMVSSGGGTYVVATGAFVVGAWRFLLGLFQVLRAAISGPQAGSVANPTVANPTAARPTSPLISPGRTFSQGSVAQDLSGALRIVGWALIADAVLRAFGLASLLIRVPVGAIFYNVPFAMTAFVLPVLLILGGIVAGALLIRGAAVAIPFALGFGAVAMLFQAYGLWSLFESGRYVPWLAWSFSAVHLTIYIVALVVLTRSLGNGDRAAAIGQADARTSPGTRP